jgi:hypothetical protein
VHASLIRHYSKEQRKMSKEAWSISKRAGSVRGRQRRSAALLKQKWLKVLRNRKSRARQALSLPQ